MSHQYHVSLNQLYGGKLGEEGRIATMEDPENSNLPVIKIQSPAEFKGPSDQDGKTLDWTPEHLFVSSAVVCLFTTFVSIAERSNLEYASFSIKATGILDKDPEIGQMITEIHEYPVLTILKEENRSKAEKILEKSEKYCLIANSMKTKIMLHPTIEILK